MCCGNYLRTVCALFWVIVCSSGREVATGCPAPCSCPRPPPSCPPGVSLALDECGCCKVCAQQFNQDCGPGRPCDHIKGLRCHLGARGDPARGLCRAEAQGRPCEFSGQMYQHGEDFQPSCQHQCSCMDGVVGCMSLCPHHLPLPKHCANPRLESPPGRCCQEWLCDDDDDDEDEDDNSISEDPPDPQPHHPLTNHISKRLLTPHGLHIPRDAFQEWASLPQSWAQIPSPQCYTQTTDWTDCSASCGYGISNRVTNKNAECKLVKETRFCQIRECGVTTMRKRGKKCRRTVRPRQQQPISFAGCTTVRRYRPRVCGVCRDGRCCKPSASRTVRLRFRCRDGESITRSLMWIQRCRCSKSYCGQSGESPLLSASLHNDIHTFSPN